MRGVFLQVRLDSTRLPGKALLKLADEPVIVHAMRALNGVDADVHCVLTSEDSADELTPYAEKHGWNVFAGPKDDVLARYALAARDYGVASIVRATGDNPLVSAVMANEAVKLARRESAHYAGFSELPVGSGVEVLDVKALNEAYEEAEDQYEREHVAPFLYRRPERYRIVVPSAPDSVKAPGTRVTLDTRDDYAYLTRLFDELYHGEPLDLMTVVPWLKENPFDGR